MSEFLLKRDSMQHKALQSRAKIRILGGGFGNGKTTTAVQLALKLAQLYPGSNGLIARETLPKLNDTIRKEFIKWCPKKSIKTFPTSAREATTCTLMNGSMINFRYIQQQGKTAESTTSNLLSATYDWIIIDQVEDPGISFKDFEDLLGRLRGSARGVFSPHDRDPVFGDYGTLPQSGPRWVILTTNPTRNWVYKKLVQPLQIYRATGRITDDLLCRRNPDTREPLLLESGKPDLMIELFEASTYENRHVYEALGATDYIDTLESAYSGQMRDRFVLGKWAAYEGLIYADYDETLHGVSRDAVREYLDTLVGQGYRPEFLESFDFGLASPSCYGVGFADHLGNVILADGFYEPSGGKTIADIAQRIKSIRREWLVDGSNLTSRCDPDLFYKKQTAGSKGLIGDSIQLMFSREGVTFQRGNNDVLNGIMKVQSYLSPRPLHRHPFHSTVGAPYFFHNIDLQWLVDEFGAYMWQRDPQDKFTDKPVDKDDHAMDMIKYMFSTRPSLAEQDKRTIEVPKYMKWQEIDRPDNPKRARYG